MIDTDVASSALAEAVASRLGELEVALARYASFAFEPDGDANAGTDGERSREAARDFVLRALHTASDPLEHAILERLVTGCATLDELAELVGLPRVAVWERVNDLVQVGLAARTLRGDGAEASAAGRALVEWIEEVAAAAERQRR